MIILHINCILHLFDGFVKCNLHFKVDFSFQDNYTCSVMEVVFTTIKSNYELALKMKTFFYRKFLEICILKMVIYHLMLKYFVHTNWILRYNFYFGIISYNLYIYKFYFTNTEKIYSNVCMGKIVQTGISEA